MEKKDVRIYSANGKGAFYFSILSERYNLIIDEKNPDFYATDVFDKNHMKYDCVKIFYTGENLTPDFNIYDYAIGFDQIVFGDRYFRLPYYRLHMTDNDWVDRDRSYFEKVVGEKTDFCNFIYSNSNRASPERVEFFKLLSKYKHVNSGGGLLNNIGKRIDKKIEWQKKHFFTIAFENSSKLGYSTEKIYDALLADTIPIYWGNPEIHLEFNPKRFINCHNFKNFDEVIIEVERLFDNPSLYLEMIQQPWFIEPEVVSYGRDEKFKAWLYNIFDQLPQNALRTTRYGWTALYRKRDIKKNFYRKMKGNQYYRRLFKRVRAVRKFIYRCFGKTN